jgi:Protein of unknown function (DUF3040)
MTNDDVRRAIGELERGLRDEDPGFLERFHRLPRREAVTSVAIFLLLAVGAVLLAIGLATASLVMWSAGLLALLTAPLLDRRNRRGA